MILAFDLAIATTSINQAYLDGGDLHVQTLGRGFAGLDTGVYESLLGGAHFVKNIETQQGYKIACLDEIAYKQGLVDQADLLRIGLELHKNNYGQYLL